MAYFLSKALPGFSQVAQKNIFSIPFIKDKRRKFLNLYNRTVTSKDSVSVLTMLSPLPLSDTLSTDLRVATRIHVSAKRFAEAHFLPLKQLSFSGERNADTARYPSLVNR